MSSSLKLLWRVLVALTVGSVSIKDVDKRDINRESNRIIKNTGEWKDTEDSGSTFMHGSRLECKACGCTIEAMMGYTFCILGPDKRTPEDGVGGIVEL